MQRKTEPSLSQDQFVISGRDSCGPVFANRACREMLGLSDETADRQTLLRYLHPEDSQECLAAWDLFLEGHQQRFQRAVRWIRPDSKKTVTLNVRAHRLLCGDIQGWLRSASADEALSRLEALTHGDP
jgi:PAS domain-containing protein